MALPPTDDTIAAIATAPGSGAVGIVRVAGPRAFEVAERLFRPAGDARVAALEGHRALFGRVVEPPDERAEARENRPERGSPSELEHGPAPRGEPRRGSEIRHERVLDEALLLGFRAPRSYTGQDVVEFQTHGGPAVLRAVLDACLACGARPAGPGEFTLRAYLAGRLDLAQAESVLSIVEATTERARRSAAHGLTRALSQRIDALQSDLTAAYGALQAALDYPEEGVEEADVDAPLRRALAGTEELLATARAGRLAERGARLALVGRPNAGKSSLLNALLGYERSIVSDAPGTTRDYLEAPLELGGVPVTAIDTAGIRRTDDRIEASGVARARALADEADLVLLLLDRSRPLDADDRTLLAELPTERTLLVSTKVDLPAAWDPATLPRSALAVAAVRGEGLGGLREAAREVLIGDAAGSEVWIGNERHAAALRDAAEAIERARAAPPDLAALDLEQGLEALASITGRGEIAEETLAHIFANFCVGK